MTRDPFLSVAPQTFPVFSNSRISSSSTIGMTQLNWTFKGMYSNQRVYLSGTSLP